MPRTIAGRDWMARIMGDGTNGDAGSSSMAPASFIALSTDGNAPDPSSTTLPGEINSGSLIRASADYGHTDGQATYTLTNEFTSDSTVTVAKVGIFNEVSGGTLCFEALLNTPVDLTPSDKLSVTYTVTL